MTNDFYKERNDVKSIVFWLIGFLIVLGAIGYALSWFSEAGTVTKKEFGASAALKKYEWFKDASETITAKESSIKVYETNVKNMEISYGDTPRKDWDRLDKEQYNQWNLEVAGLKASYNNVVKEYNAQSSKFNWDLFKTDDLPPKSYDLYLQK